MEHISTNLSNSFSRSQELGCSILTIVTRKGDTHNIFFDTSDEPEVIKQKWRIGKQRSNTTLVCELAQSNPVALHRFLLGLPAYKGKVEHKNGDTLDCRRKNLIAHISDKKPSKPKEPQEYIDRGDGTYAIVANSKKVGRQEIIIDAADLELVKPFRWSIQPTKNSDKLYATAPTWWDNDKKRQYTISMHRLLCGLTPGDGVLVDHSDGNGLNNRRKNLRVTDNSNNQRNSQSRRGSSSKYLGVCWSKYHECWIVQITSHGKKMRLGRYTDEVEAAKAYDAAAREIHGEFARPNFPEQGEYSSVRRAA